MKYFTLLACLSALCLASCSTVPNAKLNIQSASYLNPGINGTPSPVVLSVYELKSAYQFKSAKFNSLQNNAGQVLSTNLIDKQTYEIRPNSRRTIIQIISPDTHYLGLIAAYRDINESSWRSVIKIPPKTKRLPINVLLQSQGLVVGVTS